MATQAISSFSSPHIGVDLIPRINDLRIYDVVDKSSKYATSAIEEYNAYKRKCYKLVKAGCVAVGTIPDGLIIHMNFEARRIDMVDSVPQTFFAEFEVINDNATLQFIRSLGPTNSLPDKAKLYSCVYCIGSGIHHHSSVFYRNGREDLYPILLEKIQLMKDGENGMKERYNEFGLDDRCAMLALEKYNSEQGEDYELMDTNGIGCASCIAPGLIFHLNFYAKKKEDPKPITFFAEAVKFDRSCILVTFCKSLGPAEFLPEEAELFGCEYCKIEDTHHPVCGGYLTGRYKWVNN